MRGLILKDILNLKREMYIFVIFIVFYGAMSFTTGDNTMFVYIMALFAMMMPISSVSYDDKAMWDKYALTMPISRKDIVLSKYLLGYIGIAVISVVLFIYLLVTGGKIEGGILTIAGAIGLCILFESITLPIIIKFGSDKARILILLCGFLPFIILTLLEKMNIKLIPSKDFLEKLPYFLPVILLFIAIASIFLSISIYEKKEL